LEGVVQVNIRESVGLTFASCLRSILRQDPDVIMVGEIRDLETAQISIQAALTGHLVLSTLHTNDAPSTVTRLIDMEIEPFLISSTLEGVLAQRLVRTICPNCRDIYKPSTELLVELKISPEEAKEFTFYHGKGCEDCNFTGYKGRIGIFELLVVSEPIRDLILQRAATNVIAKQARQEGMMTMREDGWQKVLAGITTIEEILRVTYGVEDIDPGMDISDEPAPLTPKSPSLDAGNEVAGRPGVDKVETGEEADRA
jgi:type IV pilus assembly protein PilB